MDAEHREQPVTELIRAVVREEITTQFGHLSQPPWPWERQRTPDVRVAELDAMRAQRDNAVRRAEDSEASEAGLREQLERTEQDLRIAKAAAAPSREHFDRSREFGQEVEKLRAERDALRNRLDGLDADDTLPDPEDLAEAREREEVLQGRLDAALAEIKEVCDQRDSALRDADQLRSSLALATRDRDEARNSVRYYEDSAKAMRNERDKALEQQAVEAERAAMQENREFGDQVEKLLKVRAEVLSEQDAMKELAEHCCRTSCVPESVCAKVREERDAAQQELSQVKREREEAYHATNQATAEANRLYKELQELRGDNPDETEKELPAGVKAYLEADRSEPYGVDPDPVETEAAADADQDWGWAKEQLKAGERVRFNAWAPGAYADEDEGTRYLHGMDGQSPTLSADWSPTLHEANTAGWRLLKDDMPDPVETEEEREARRERGRLATTGQSWDWAKARMMAAEKVRFRTWDPALYVRQPLRMGPYSQVRKGEGEINPNWRPTLYEASTPGWEVFEETKQEDAK